MPVTTGATIGIAPYTVAEQIRPPAGSALTAAVIILRLLRAVQLNRATLLEARRASARRRWSSLSRPSLASPDQRQPARAHRHQQHLRHGHPARGRHRRVCWCDGVVLHTMKQGLWLLLNEKSLESQSVIGPSTRCSTNVECLHPGSHMSRLPSTPPQRAVPAELTVCQKTNRKDRP